MASSFHFSRNLESDIGTDAILAICPRYVEEGTTDTPASDDVIDSTDGATAEESPLKTRWKILEVIYLTCVKISDKSAAFGKALTDAGLLKTTTDTLNREDYKNKCTGEVSHDMFSNLPKKFPCSSQ